jgi:hypothetical protein
MSGVHVAQKTFDIQCLAMSGIKGLDALVNFDAKSPQLFQMG